MTVFSMLDCLAFRYGLCMGASFSCSHLVLAETAQSVSELRLTVSRLPRHRLLWARCGTVGHTESQSMDTIDNNCHVKKIGALAREHSTPLLDDERTVIRCRGCMQITKSTTLLPAHYIMLNCSYLSTALPPLMRILQSARLLSPRPLTSVCCFVHHSRPMWS